MFITCGYNFCSDKSALHPAPVNNDAFDKTRMQNGIFDHWNATADVNSPYSPNIPTVWDYLTIMNANFNGNINAGNLDILGQLEGFKLKRRKTTEANWITLAYFPVGGSVNKFLYNDNFAVNGFEYEYAFVPIVNGNEGKYITETIDAQFDGVFICDADTVYRFYANVDYGTGERVQKVGVFEPYGRKYPVVVSNGLLNYYKGTIGGTVLPNNYLKDGNLDRWAMVQEREQLLDFLTNKKAKILKDYNGNSWLMVISGSPSITYESKFWNGIANVSADYVEIGDVNNQKDLYEAGLVSEVE